ncbi:LuxR family transcriptional regulator [Streptomyces sp. CC224B]|uniref:helix-turn-helix transcriptional regulator n=1 Tax=Streptomyces sp. CC224B TaxID=3044571 RepID=UPI0024A7E112|nr:LuxR family transcriptional regulator [Streptomyces sp. CC224B]
MAAPHPAPDLLDAAVQVRQAARDAPRTGFRQVLTALSGILEYDHASLTRWDPHRRRHTTLAGTYPEHATAYIENRLHHDPVFAVLHSPAQGGLWLTDMPAHLLAASPGFTDVLRPLGIAGGVAQCLFTAEGRYAGMLNISTRHPRRAPDTARAAVTLLTESLAAALAPATAPSPRPPAAVPAVPGAATRPPGPLSPRERQVLAELAAGRTNRQIAQRLHITPRTVGTHIEHILAKLDAPNRAAAAARAAAWGITPAP